MNKLTLFGFGAASVALSATVFSFTDGVFPGKTHPVLGTVPADIVRQAPGCGMCHGAGPSTAHVDVTPALRSLDPGQSISVATTVTGGQLGPGGEIEGGFVTEATRGMFTPGITSQISPDGRFVSHFFAFLGMRNWQYTYTAPAVPGMVELYAAANTSNVDGTEMGDEWAFRGAPGEQGQATPVKLYVNAPGVIRHGGGCVGSFGNWPVLGSQQVPSVGNGNFGFELHGAPTSAPVTMFLGFNPAFQVPLDLIGVTGCTLYVNPIATFGATTTPGSSVRGEGVATFPMPIPNVASHVGFSFEVQAVILDTAVSRQLPLTLTNALRFTIQ